MRARVLNLTGAALVPLALWTLLLQYSRTFRSWDGSGLELSLHSSVQAQDSSSWLANIGGGW
jgi:hypothetical protein